MTTTMVSGTILICVKVPINKNPRTVSSTVATSQKTNVRRKALLPGMLSLSFLLTAKKRRKTGSTWATTDKKFSLSKGGSSWVVWWAIKTC